MSLSCCLDLGFLPLGVPPCFNITNLLTVCWESTHRWSFGQGSCLFENGFILISLNLYIVNSAANRILGLKSISSPNAAKPFLCFLLSLSIIAEKSDECQFVFFVCEMALFSLSKHWGCSLYPRLSEISQRCFLTWVSFLSLCQALNILFQYRKFMFCNSGIFKIFLYCAFEIFLSSILFILCGILIKWMLIFWISSLIFLYFLFSFIKMSLVLTSSTPTAFFKTSITNY